MEPLDTTRSYERLRRFQSVTAAALYRLDVPDLLDELLGRVRDALHADTATVLLLDADSRQLVVTAASGLREELRLGLRVDIGRGFAGRIAQSREPVLLVEVTPGDVVNPAILQLGIRSLLGVPIFTDDEVIGVLNIGTVTPRRFTADDILLLQLAADRVTTAQQVRAYQRDHHAALALQGSLVPPQLPTVEGLQLAARYRPGHEFGIGGDWYDVFPLPGGWLGAVIGDVSGHGLASAVVMGRIRSALRAYTLMTDDPGQALTLLARKVHHFEAGSLTTALYMMISPDRRTLRLSSAGHLRPVLAALGADTALVDMPVDAPLGVGRNPHARHTTVIDLPAGGLLLGYTDGLVERRDRIIDVGIKTLLHAVQPDDPETVCDVVLSHVASERRDDDIAVLAIRRQ